jgi:hypothetical protein
VAALRTDFTAFVLDLMDFIEEKIAEALDAEESLIGAITEAAGVLSLLRDRLPETTS